MAPAVSVIMAAHNAERTIQAAIRSVLQQTRGDWELVVVDDGSSDDTCARVAELDDDRITVVSQSQSGVSAARNTGIGRSRGRYVCPLDADDLLLPSFFESMLLALETDDAAGFAYTDAWTLDDVTGRIRRASAKAHQQPPLTPPRAPLEFFRLLLERNFVYGCTVIRRAVLDEVGGYRTDLATGEDYELWLRIVARGHAALRVPGRLAVYREGQPSSSSSDLARIHGDNVRLLEIIAATYPVDDSVRQRARERADEERRVVRAAREGTSGLQAALQPLRRLRRRLLRPFLWLSTRPPEVEALLAETGGWPT